MGKNNYNDKKKYNKKSIYKDDYDDDYDIKPKSNKREPKAKQPEMDDYMLLCFEKERGNKRRENKKKEKDRRNKKEYLYE